MRAIAICLFEKIGAILQARTGSKMSRGRLSLLTPGGCNVTPVICLTISTWLLVGSYVYTDTHSTSDMKYTGHVYNTEL